MIKIIKYFDRTEIGKIHQVLQVHSKRLAKSWLQIYTIQGDMK